MLGFVVRRAAWSLVTLVVFVTIVFFAVNLLFPFDYVTAFHIGTPPEVLEEMRRERGLDRPLVVQYLSYLGELTTGSLGASFAGPSVARILWDQALPATLLVFAVGGIVAYLFGAWLGRAVAWQRRRTVSAATTTAGVLAYTAFPPWLAFLLIYAFTGPLFAARPHLGLPIDSRAMWATSPWTHQAVMLRMSATLLLALIVALIVRGWMRRRGWWRWATAASLPLPLAAAVASWYAAGFGPEALDLLLRADPRAGVGHGSTLLVFAAFVILAFGEITFVTRTSMAAERREAYVTTARAVGLDELEVRERHVAPNATLPAMSRFFASVPYILAGLIIIEHEFALQGLSTTFFQAVEAVDVPLILGVLVTVGLLVLALRLALEITHAWIDPRIRVPTTRP